MDKHELLKMARNPAHIEGIFNYCDRWCERCPLTSRCLVFAMESAEKQSGGGKGTEDDLAQDLKETLRLTLELMEDMEKDLPAEPASNDIVMEPDQAVTPVFSLPDTQTLLQAVTTSQVTLRSARHYVDLVKDWFDSHASLFEEKERLLKARAMQIPSAEDIQLEAQQIADAIAVVRWYQIQIFAKLTRASNHLETLAVESNRTRCGNDLLAALRHDMDGSAKVALIGIQRSTSAWLALRRHLTDQADSILHVLIHLERLRRYLVTAFPDAETFVRPGFDELAQEN